MIVRLNILWYISWAWQAVFHEMVQYNLRILDYITDMALKKSDRVDLTEKKKTRKYTNTNFNIPVPLLMQAHVLALRFY